MCYPIEIPDDLGAAIRDEAGITSLSTHIGVTELGKISKEIIERFTQKYKIPEWNAQKIYARFFEAASSILRYYLTKQEIVGVEPYYALVQLAHRLGVIDAEAKNMMLGEIKRVLCNNSEYNFCNRTNLRVCEEKTWQYLNQFSVIFTTNYDNLLKVSGQDPIYLHGSFDEDNIVLGINEYEKLRKDPCRTRIEKLTNFNYDEIHIFGYSGRNDMHINSAINAKGCKIVFYCADGLKEADKGGQAWDELHNEDFQKIVKHLFGIIEEDDTRIEFRDRDEIWEQICFENPLLIPHRYDPKLSVHETQVAIKYIKDVFEEKLASKLSLLRVSAPLFVKSNSGLNDNLNGVERPVGFDVSCDTGTTVEIVHSLAKWKRYALRQYDFSLGEGLYTDMNAIRRDETTDNLHSVYVDQWDWERVIRNEDRTLDYLKKVVNVIYEAIVEVEKELLIRFPALKCESPQCESLQRKEPQRGRPRCELIRSELPSQITFLTSQELEDKYPDLSPAEREKKAAKEHGAIFVMQVGKTLKSGKVHDKRAPDYDDWELNGDIIFYYSPLKCAMEISSMGIRVDSESLRRQLCDANCMNRASLPFQKELLEGLLPLSIGGGVGQSRLCMFLLNKAHIGEVQVSVWPEEVKGEYGKHGVVLL